MVSIDDRLNQIIRELIGNGITLEQAVEAFEGKYIVAAMSASRGNVTQASKALGVHRNTLHNKLRTLPLLESAPFDPHPVPYDRSVGRDAKLVRLGFGRAQMAQRRAWIAGYLNLFEHRFDAWTAAPAVPLAYAETYQAAMTQRSGAMLKAMSVGYIITQREGRFVALRDIHALPMAYLRGADGRIAGTSLLAFTGSSMFVTADAPFDATLVVTQQLVPGWRAAIDGHEDRKSVV